MTEPDREIRYISFIVTQAKSSTTTPPPSSLLMTPGYA